MSADRPAAADDLTADGRASARLAVLAAALDGDAGAAYHFLSGLLGEGVSFEEILFEILAPLEGEVGRRWHEGDLSISEEHLVTSTLETVVSLLAGSFDLPPDAPRLVVACPEGEAHSLPARMIWAYLVYRGRRAAFLGPGYPAVDLGGFLRAQRPAALLLSGTVAAALPGARAAVREAHASGIPVLAGGAAFGPDGGRARALGADAWAAHPTEIETTLNTWRPDPAAAEAAVTARAPGLEWDLPADGRRRVVAAALAGLGAAPAAAGWEGPGVTAALEALFDAAAAALLVDDPALLAEFIRWQRELAGYSGKGDITPDLIAALTAALHEVSPVAARLLAGAAAG